MGMDLPVGRFQRRQHPQQELTHQMFKNDIKKQQVI
jgi:hypothetical protein